MEDVEGKAEETEECSRETKAEESKSGKRDVKKKERVEVSNKRVCHGCFPSLCSHGEFVEVASELEVVDVGGCCV